MIMKNQEGSVKEAHINNVLLLFYLVKNKKQSLHYLYNREIYHNRK